jgi:hypothetical protein
MGAIPLGHRNRGGALSTDSIPDIERAILLSKHKGRTVYVDSSRSSSGNGSSWDSAYTTLDEAVAAALADDLILIAPGHTETVASAADIAVAANGVTIIGLGRGNRRPTFTWTATAATWTVTGSGVTIANIRVSAAIDEVVKLFSVTGSYCTLDGIEYFETASCQAIQFLLTSAAADYLTVKNCFFYQANAAGSAQLWIELVGCDCARILDNVFILALNNAATSACINGSTAVVNCQIAGNTILQTGGTTQVSAILLAANSTGFVHDNRVAAAVTTLAGTVALASAYGAENYTLNTANKSGIIDPVADS